MVANLGRNMWDYNHLCVWWKNPSTFICKHHKQDATLQDNKCVLRDSSVGIVTGYALDGPGSIPGSAQFFSSPDQLWGSQHGFKSICIVLYTPKYGRAIAQAASRWLPTAAARVRSQVRSCGICDGQSGTGAGFLRVLRFPLPIIIPPTAP
jgi:hypothetical protein